MKTFITNSNTETQKLADDIAKKFTSGVVALNGDLGTGKTTFVQGFAKGLGIKEIITSPTFVLIRQHKIPKTTKFLYHIDLYRIDNLTGFGLEEILSEPENLVLIEWAEKIKHLLPKDTIHIKFETLSKDKRKITIN